MRILHSLLLFASLLAVSYCVSHEELLDKYRFNSRLSPSYTIYWNFDIEKENISIAVRARTEGWVGFGLSRNGQMPYSDVVIGWVNGYNQKTFFEDRYAWGRYEPSIDEEQNWFLLNGDEEYGYTTLQFTRNFTTCDEITDLDITSGTARVMGAYHDEDPTPGYSIKPHKFKMAKSLNLLKGLPTERSTPSDSNSFVIRNEQYRVPDTQTTYYCSIHYLPRVIFDADTNQEPVYLYKVAPLISWRNRRYVHHMLVFICPMNSNIVEDGICDEIANSFFGCFGGQIISAWAVGGEDYVFPENVSFPLGGRGQPNKIMLEVHYDNPMRHAGIVDSSGIEFYYTKQKPLYEAGGLSIAQPIVPLMVIPPRDEFFRHSATCLSSCTDKYLPEGGITVFASFLHTHLIGTALRVRHFRNNTECGKIEELPPIDENWEYDFDYQQLSNLPQPLQVLRGDAIRVNCYYNSRSRKRVTLGGESTRQEMCQALLYYYPRTPLTNCGSFADPDVAFRPFLKRHLYPYYGNERSINDTIFALYRHYHAGVRSQFDHNIWWNERAKREFQEAMDNAPFEREFCANEKNTVKKEPALRPVFTGADCPYVKPNECNPLATPPPPCCSRVNSSSGNQGGATGSARKRRTTHTDAITGGGCGDHGCSSSAGDTKPALAVLSIFVLASLAAHHAVIV